jgi:CRISPR-associated protein Csx10
MRIYFSLTNLEPLVISQSNASTNNHQCLDHIPGSAILGAIASKLYSSLSPEQSFTLFHSGNCRFGPAYPIHDNEVSMPIPAAWHKIKNDYSALSNHAAKDFIRNQAQQYQQCRSGFITSNNLDVPVKQGLTTRTAIEEQTQKASDGQLYSYAYIEAGQHFGAWIESGEATLLELVRPLLNGELNIGRSRSSEFGRVRLHCPNTQPASHQVTAQGKQLVLWCLSDIECRDAWGMPTLTPNANELHPALKGELDTTRSFIRSNKVRRFNRARNGFDSEQQLISRGSVLTFNLEEEATDKILTDLADQGVGFNRQQGLGWVNVNPHWANMPAPEHSVLFHALKLSPQPEEILAEPELDTPLLRWVKVKQQQSQANQRQTNQIQNLHQQIYDAYSNARHFRNTPQNYQAGPSASQWRRLAELVRNYNDDTWSKQAFQGEAAICKPHGDPDGWGIDWQEQGKLLTFAEKVENLLDGIDVNAMRQLLEVLCRYDLSNRDGLKRFRENHLTPPKGGKS